MKDFHSILLFSIACWSFTYSSEGADNPDSPACFTVATKSFGQVIKMVGYIDRSTQGRFEAVADLNPSIDTLWIESCDGSDDDEANVIFCRHVFNRGFNTYMEEGNEAYSGGVDLFVSGVNRYAHPRAILGVHSWSDSNGTNAALLPRSDPDHQRYITLYTDTWMTQEQSEAFYFFTISAAPPQTVHNMTRDERLQFFITTTDSWPVSIEPLQIVNYELDQSASDLWTYRLDWQGRANVSYSLFQSPNLRDWDLVKKAIVGKGELISETVESVPTSKDTQLFFRVQESE